MKLSEVKNGTFCLLRNGFIGRIYTINPPAYVRIISDDFDKVIYGYNDDLTSNGHESLDIVILYNDISWTECIWERPTPFHKSDLKNGMIVRITSNGSFDSLALVNNDLLLYEDGRRFHDLMLFDDDMISDDGAVNRSIDVVSYSKSNDMSFNGLFRELKTIWRRD